VLPQYGVNKEYELTLDKEISEEDFKNITEVGTDFDGEMIKPVSLEMKDKKNLKIVLSQGKYHEIKRIFYRRGYKVIALRRTKFAFLELGDLEVGKYRFLDALEEEKLYNLVGMEKEQKVFTVSRKNTNLV
jgi:16S rRNA pseudouridine516 synthase